MIRILLWFEKKKFRVNFVKFEYDIVILYIWKKLCKDFGKFKIKLWIKWVGFEFSIGDK